MMNAVPPDIHRKLRQVLIDCGPFDDDRQLRAVFADGRLSPWRHSLPQAGSVVDRVDFVIAFLHNKQRGDTHENALVLFLQVLSERIDPGDACNACLAELARQLQLAIGGEIRPSSTTNPPNQAVFAQAETPVFKPVWTKARLEEEYPVVAGWLEKRLGEIRQSLKGASKVDRIGAQMWSIGRLLQGNPAHLLGLQIEIESVPGGITDVWIKCREQGSLDHYQWLVQEMSELPALTWLENENGRVTGERTKAGPPVGDQDISRRTDLILPEANPQAEQMVTIAADEKLLRRARAVGLVSVPKVADDSMKQVTTGTGWLITPQLALTCWHVVQARTHWEAPAPEGDLQRQVKNLLLRFDHTLPAQGVEYGLARLEHFHAQLDYALLRLTDRDDFPLARRGYLALDTDLPLTMQSQLLILQHPQGQIQQRTAGFYVKPSSQRGRILYTAPTAGGASGAPVLNVTNWQVVALHTGENQNESLREGLLLKTILADLSQQRPDLYQEIMTCQNDKE